MSDTSRTGNVSMEFAGPVPGVLGASNGYHVVVWVQSSGGASFTRPSQEERDYYAEQGKPAPEWQCEYFEFDGVRWPEAPLSIELWKGSAKLRSLCIAGLQGRSELEVCRELPELERFIQKHGLSPEKLTFHDALLRAAAAAGVIQISRTSATQSASSKPTIENGESPWWRRALRRAWPQRHVA